MRYAASLAIVATALAAGLTLVAVRALGPSVEAHPVTRVAATHLGWAGYLSLSLVVVAVGLRLLAVLPFSEWGIRVVALAKVVDASRDAWIVAHHPEIDGVALAGSLPAIVVVVLAAVAALLIVRGWPTPRLSADPEVAV